MRLQTTALAICALALAVACGEESKKATKSVCPSQQTLTYDNFGKSFMSSYCTRCHSAASTDRKGAPSDHNFDTVQGVRGNREHIDERAAAGPAATNTIMPIDSPKPSDEERKKLGEWLACGAP